MDKLLKLIKGHKYVIGIPLVISWLFGFICLVNSVFTWWAVIFIAIFWAFSVLGWIEIMRRYT